MKDAFAQLEAEITSFGGDEQQYADYYLFEPWDVQERPEWLLKQARKDGIDLYSDALLPHIGRDPHPFQTGYMQSGKFFRALIAATQVGKSLVALMDMLVALTGEIPIALRHEAGVDSGIKRQLSKRNIRRFGRYDAVSNAFIDNDDSVVIPDNINEWTCGNVIGAGAYPMHKIGDLGAEGWLGTYMRALTSYWWPLFAEDGRRIIPEFLIDRTKGNGGYSRRDNIIYLIRDAKLTAITFESGYNRFEARKVFVIVLDEEPVDQRVVQAAQQHTEFLSMVMTPYNGITYTKNLFFDKVTPDKEVFHATQYDSPYQNRGDIDMKRQNMPPYEIGSRVYGLHTEATGRPYYDREKLNAWLNRYTFPYKGTQFVPKADMDDATPDVDIREDQEDLQWVWRVYEEPKQGVAYLGVADPAEGAETPEEAGDTSCVMITRAPIGNETRPVICATLRSTLEIPFFARAVRYGLCAYNNAVLASETRRGAANATFASETRDYPYWYNHISINDATNKPKQHRGFDTNCATRSSLFDLITGWLGEHVAGEHPNIPDETLLRELLACIVGKNGRPDHKKGHTLDMAICFGISLFVHKHAPEQIVCNKQELKKEPFAKLKRLVGLDRDTKKQKYLASNLPAWRK